MLPIWLLFLLVVAIVSIIVVVVIVIKETLLAGIVTVIPPKVLELLAGRAIIVWPHLHHLFLLQVSLRRNRITSKKTSSSKE
jgi:hypothetical protein